MNESNTWEFLRDVALPLGHYSRIESPDTAPGFPDVHYTIAIDNPFYDDWSATGTLELKYSNYDLVPFPDEDKGLHKSQKKWIKHQLQHNGTVWIIAEVRECIYCIPGAYYADFNGAKRVDLENWAEAVLYRDQPQDAARKLKELLT